jgi:tight adherence protein C
MNMFFPAAMAIIVWVIISGLVFVSHSFTFPFPRRDAGHPVLLRTNPVLRFGAGLLATGAFVLIATASTEAAMIASATPLFFLFLSFAWHQRNSKKRKALIIRDFPLLLDHLVLQIESGHSIQEALRSSAGLFTKICPIASGLRQLDEFMIVGRSLSEALKKFGEMLDAPETDVPLMAIIQAVQHGTPLGKILREQSKRIRENLILEGEQFANALSVKILIPLLFFIFPASFLVIFSPVVVALSGGLK